MNYYSNQTETIERVIRGRIYYGTIHRDTSIFCRNFNQLLRAPGGVGKTFVLSSILIPKIQSQSLLHPGLLNNK